jgi:hypothetical protein
MTGYDDEQENGDGSDCIGYCVSRGILCNQQNKIET